MADWTEQFDEIKHFFWISLRMKPTWTEVNQTMLKVSERDENFDLDENSPKVFTQYGFVKTYCTDEKLQEWKSNKVPTEMRWVELFKHMNKNSIPYLNFAQVVEFASCLPGANAITERVFSEVTHSWKKESSQLSIDTLKVMLIVKFNLDYTCSEFFDFIKGNTEILKQMTSQNKYDFKNAGTKSANEESVNLNMSIDE